MAERTGEPADSAGPILRRRSTQARSPPPSRRASTSPGARPRSLEPADTRADVIVTVCDRAHEELDPAPVAALVDPDPVDVGRARAFDAALAELDRRITAISP